MSEMISINPLHKPLSVHRFLLSITLEPTAKNNFGSRPPISSEVSFNAAELLFIAFT